MFTFSFYNDIWTFTSPFRLYEQIIGTFNVVYDLLLHSDISVCSRITDCSVLYNITVVYSYQTYCVCMFNFGILVSYCPVWGSLTVAPSLAPSLSLTS